MKKDDNIPKTPAEHEPPEGEAPPPDLFQKTLDDSALPAQDGTTETPQRDSEVRHRRLTASSTPLPPPDLNAATINGAIPSAIPAEEDALDLNMRTINDEDTSASAAFKISDPGAEALPLDLNALTINQSADDAVDLIGKTITDSESALPDLNAATLAGAPALGTQGVTPSQAGSDTSNRPPSGFDLDMDTLSTISEDVQAQWAATISEGLTEGMTIKGKHEDDKKDIGKSTHITVNPRNVIDHTSRRRLTERMAVGERTVTGSPDAQTRADYELIDVLGEGGMGIVYRARQTSVDRSIAIKMIKSEACADIAARDKFLFEAAVTGDLDHPNIVPIHDLGDSGTGTLFYSMKHVKGQPWDNAVKEKSLSENLDILEDVCNAIAFAHDRGTLHRDLKPENIMLGGYGEVLVMDWGLAAAIKDSAKAARLTKKTSVCGTPAYMSPEMAVGDGTKIGVVSDVYLLGGILFEIIAGFPPHTGDSVLKCLENAALNVFRPTDKSGELMDIALKAMATETEDRYPTVKEFQEAIKEYESHYESISLADRAEKDLVQANESREYEEYNRAVFGFQEALNLWKKNKEAQEGLSRARLDYASCALVKDDLDLAESQLVEMTEPFRKLRNKVIEARVEREKRQRQLRMAKYLGVAAVLVIVAGSLLGTYLVYGEQKKAKAEAVRAQKEKLQADIARADAEKANEKTKAALDEAKIARDSAKEEEKNAKIALAKAHQAELARRFGEAREEKLRDASRWALSVDAAKQRQAEAAALYAIPIEKTVALAHEAATIKMRLIPEGLFTMGSLPSEKGRGQDEPLHDVKLTRPFYISAYETTRRQWESLLAETPSATKGRSVTGRYPVESVTYTDIVQRFLPALQKKAEKGWTFDLPTEAEWEYACRAGSAASFHFGNNEGAFADAGWSIRNSEKRVHATGLKQPNAWGLYDMHGNVAEWCKDWYAEDFYLLGADKEKNDAVNTLLQLENPTGKDFAALLRFIENPYKADKGNASFRVIRGGFWGVFPDQCRSAHRSNGHPETQKGSRIGFRVILRPNQELAPVNNTLPALPNTAEAATEKTNN